MKKIFAVALVLALATGALLFAYLRQLEERPEQEIQTEQVVVAAAEIPPYTAITPELVEEKQLPVGSAGINSAHSASEVLGKVSDSVILAGEQLCPAKLKTMGSSADGLSYAVPEGYRAYTVLVGEGSGVGWFIRQGDMVDVLADINDLTMTVKNVTNGHTVMLAAECCTVLKIGPATFTDSDSPQAYTSVTLLVTPEQAQRLMYAENEGNLRLLLRGVDDKNELALGELRLENVLDHALKALE